MTAEFPGADGAFDPADLRQRAEPLEALPVRWDDKDTLADGEPGVDGTAEGIADDGHEADDEEVEAWLLEQARLRAEQRRAQEAETDAAEAEATLAEWEGLLAYAPEIAARANAIYHERLSVARKGLGRLGLRKQVRMDLQSVTPNASVWGIREVGWRILFHRIVESTDPYMGGARGWVIGETVLSGDGSAQPTAEKSARDEDDDDLWELPVDEQPAEEEEPLEPHEPAPEPRHDPSRDREFIILTAPTPARRGKKAVPGGLIRAVVRDTAATDTNGVLLHRLGPGMKPRSASNAEPAKKLRFFARYWAARREDAAKDRLERIEAYVERNTARERRLHLPGREPTYTRGFISTSEVRLLAPISPDALKNKHSRAKLLGKASDSDTPLSLRVFDALEAFADRLGIPREDEDTEQAYDTHLDQE